MKCSLGISNFLEDISSLSFLLFSSISLHCSLRSLSCLSLLFFGTLHSVGYIFPFPLPVASLLFSVICKASSDNHFAFLHFSLGWFWSLNSVQCYKPASIVFQALCLSDLIPWIYLSLPLCNCKGLWIIIFTISWYSFVSSLLFQKYHSKYPPSWSLNVHRVLYYKRETCLMCKIKVSKVLLTRKCLRTLCVCYCSWRYCEVKTLVNMMVRTLPWL